MSDIDITDSAYLSGNESEIGSVYSDLVPAQDVDQYIANLQQEEAGRNELAEAGYESPAPELDQSIGAEIEVPAEHDGGSGDDGEARVRRDFNRFGERGTVQHEVLGDRIVESLARNAAGKGQTRLVRESIRLGDESLSRFGEKITKVSAMLRSKGTVYGISKHDQPSPHYHIFHTCPWSWYCCRCYKPDGRGKRYLKTTVLTAVTADDWQRLLLYYSTDGRLLQHIFSGEAHVDALYGIKFVFHNRLPTLLEGYPESMEDGNSSGQKRAFSESDEEGHGSNRRTKRGTDGPERSKDYSTASKIETFIMKHPVAPLQNACKTTYWLSSPYKYRGVSDRTYQQVLTTIRAKVSHWTIADYVKLYENCKPWFQCLNGNLEEHYLSIDDSVMEIENLISRQMTDIWASDNIDEMDGKQDFWETLYKILDRNYGKINTLELVGPPSCGKTYFTNFICDFFLAVGHIENFTRQNNFPLQSAYNQRILHWNEAQCEQSKLEDAKKILGGDPCAANIKYQDTQVITKTPVIITANRRHIPWTEAFRVRMIRYDWSDVGLSDDSKQPPNPLALLEIFRNYGLIN